MGGGAADGGLWAETAEPWGQPHRPEVGDAADHDLVAKTMASWGGREWVAAGL